MGGGAPEGTQGGPCTLPLPDTLLPGVGWGPGPRRAVPGVCLLSLASTARVSCSLVPATGPRVCVSSLDRLIEPVLTRRA